MENNNSLPLALPLAENFTDESLQEVAENTSPLVNQTTHIEPIEEDTNNTLTCDNSHYMKNNNCLPLAFPGAEGFGAKSLGGRGGDIYHVSNLNDSGSGSLRTCIEAEGKRNCVFDIGGTIELLSPLVVKNPYLSILGQTTPKDSGGVTLKAKKSSTYDGTLLQIVTNNVVVRYMRLRRGSMTEDTYSSAGDCLTMGSANSDDAHDIIIDHCSISWSFDENIDTWYNIKNLTMQWTISSEGLYESSHTYNDPNNAEYNTTTTGHSKGAIAYKDEDVSLHHMLYASNDARNPRLDSCNNVQIKNIISYNFRSFGAEYEGGINSIEDSIFKYGPSSKTRRHPITNVKGYLYLSNTKAINNSDTVYRSSDGELSTTDTTGTIIATDTWEYLMGHNEFKDTIKMIADYDETIFRVQAKPKQPDVPVTIIPLNDLERELISSVGASYIRDSVDTRVIEELENGNTGAIINSPDDVGGWPVLAQGTPVVDTDGDGMPDSYESANNLDINVKDGNQDANNDGYTNFEEYTNWILTSN